MRSGYAEYHSSKSQSFQARTQASPSSWSLASEKSVPPKPVTPDGKLTEAQVPLMSMSLMRSSIR
jgi:hypothetical protein